MPDQVPHGASHLDISEMHELVDVIASQTLFRFIDPEGGCASKLEEVASHDFDVKYALATVNCTQALRLALLSTRPCIGDKVYIPAVTFVATAGAVLSCGLIPVLAPVDERFLLDWKKLPADAERVIVVHLDGNVADCPEELPPSVRFVIEDCAQAMGGHHADGTPFGGRTHAAAFSFQHNKVLSSGEGGLLLSRSKEAWQIMRDYHDHGSKRKQGEYPSFDDTCSFGENLVINEQTAAIQLQQLRHLEDVTSYLSESHDLLEATIQSEVLPVSDAFRIVPRGPHEVKLSLRLECPTEGLRDRVVANLTAADLGAWTMERYYLPRHPVIKNRASVYCDGFPWSLAPEYSIDETRLNGTLDRLKRTINLQIAPRLSQDERAEQAKAFALQLLKSLSEVKEGRL